MFNFDLKADLTVGTADLPPLFNQRVRQGMWLHWDGNNNQVEERNKSAAIGAGATEDVARSGVARSGREVGAGSQAAGVSRRRDRSEQGRDADAQVYQTACAQLPRHRRRGRRDR